MFHDGLFNSTLEVIGNFLRKNERVDISDELNFDSKSLLLLSYNPLLETVLVILFFWTGGICDDCGNGKHRIIYRLINLY